MSRQRASAIRNAAVGLVGGLILTACGDDGNGAGRDFCGDGVPALVELARLAPEPDNDDFADVVSLLEDVEPPSSIADDWHQVVTALVALRDQDGGQPDEVAQAQARFLSLREELLRIEGYIPTACAGG